MKRLPIYTSRTVAGTIKKFDARDTTDKPPLPKPEQNHRTLKPNGNGVTSIHTTSTLEKTSTHTSRVEQIKEKLSSNEKLNTLSAASPTVRFRSPSPSLLRKTQAVIAKEQSNEYYVSKHGKYVPDQQSPTVNNKDKPKSDSFRKAAAFWNSNT